MIKIVQGHLPKMFFECYVALAEMAAATAVSTAGGGDGRALQYRDLLLGHILMSKRLQLLEIREIFYTCCIPQVERERLAHEFLDLRLEGLLEARM